MRNKPSTVATFVTFVVLLTLSASTRLSAQFASPNATVTSLTGQFISRDARLGGPSALALQFSTNNQYVCLDAALVSVSCERIRHHLMERLHVNAPWRGKVFLSIHRAESIDEPVGLLSERFSNGWQYRLDLPDVLDRDRYVRAVVQVLLLEMANRNVPPRAPELPLWLVEGLTRQFLASSELQIVLQPPARKANGLPINDVFYESRRPTTLASQRDDPLALARAVLRTNDFFSFEQLSWPAEDQLSGQQRDLFACSAQLFVAELLRMDNGASGMLRFLDQLPNYYNWQLAFLSAFRPAFDRPLDVEKWWNLRWVSFTGTEASQRWPLAESWSHLDDSLHAPAEMRVSNDQLPNHSEASLQTLLSKWDENSNSDVLKSKLREFELLRLRLDPHVLPILEGYRRVLEGFLKESKPSGVTALVRRDAAIESARSQAIKHLDLLDAQRRDAAARPETIATTEKTTASK